MSYIDENLMAGENVIYRAQLHWVIFTLPVVLWILGLFHFIFVVAAVFTSISSLITYISSEFGVTNKRVITSNR